jgi:hypothetical protein
MKMYPVLNKVPRHEGVSCALLSTTSWRRILRFTKYHANNNMLSIWMKYDNKVQATFHPAYVSSLHNNPHAFVV